MSLNTLSLDKEEVCLKGKRLYVYRPARLEDVFQGDPFLEAHRFPFLGDDLASKPCPC